MLCLLLENGLKILLIKVTNIFIFRIWNLSFTQFNISNMIKFIWFLIYISECSIKFIVIKNRNSNNIIDDLILATTVDYAIFNYSPWRKILDFFFIKNFLTLKSLSALFDFHVSQFCSAIFSNFLLRIHDSKRKTISITMPRPEKASLISFSETWPNACPAERTAPDQSPAATKLNARNVGQVSLDIP